jgi:CHAT domain-containing protein/tetratricopeptide (TPR) repeat protein
MAGDECEERAALAARLADQGNYNGAVAAATEAVDQLRTAHGRTHAAAIAMVLCLSEIHEQFGALRLARSVVTEELADFADDPQTDFEQVVAQTKLFVRASGLSKAMNDFGPAAEYLCSGLKLQERFFSMIAGGPSNAQLGDLGCGLNELGILYRSLGQSENALAAFKKARSYASQGYGELDDRTLTIASNGATQLVALRRFREAAAILDAIPLDSLNDMSARINLSGNKAAAHAGTGDLEAAVGDAETAVRLILHDYIQRIADNEPGLGGNTEQQWLGLWSALICMAVKPDALPSARQLAATMILTRAGMVDEARRLGMRLVHRDGDAETLREALAAEARRVAELYLAPEVRDDLLLPGSPSAGADERLDELRREVLRHSLRYRSPEPPIPPRAIDEALPADSALVVYAIYAAKDLASDAFSTDPRLAACVFRAGRPFSMFDLGLRSDIAVPLPADIQGPDHRSILQKGYRALLAPLAGELDGVRELLVVGNLLDGVPFEALIDNEGRYLVETFAVRCVASAYEILRESRRDVTPIRPLSASSVFSDPHFNAGNGPLRKGIVELLPPLPGAQREGRAIAGILNLPQDRHLEGCNATEEAIKSLHGPVVLHLATHGVWWEAWDDSAYDRAIMQAMVHAVGAIPETVRNMELSSPLLPGRVRGWLALAGANRVKLEEDREDGILTGIEVEMLDLHHTEMVVLSTCRSGMGATTLADSSEGLRTALYIAGSRTRVVSLWPVHDDVAAAMMSAWYRRLARGEDRAEALRQIKLEMLAGDFVLSPERLDADSSAPRHQVWTLADPRLWASFVLEGAAGPISSFAEPAS